MKSFLSAKRFFAGAVLSVAICTFSRAQGVEPIPSGLVWLTQGWKYHAGDNPAWADPAWNDSDWESHPPQQQTDSCAHGCWYRLRIALPHAQPASLSLLLLAQSGVFETYLDGRRSGSAHFQRWWQVREPMEFVLPLPAYQRQVLLAIRIRPPRLSFDANEAASLRAAVGGPQAVRDAAEAHRTLRVIRFLPSGAINLAIVISGCALLLAFVLEQHRREYFWLGLYLLLLGGSSGIYTASIYAIVPGNANEIFSDPATYLAILAETAFAFAFIGRRPNRLWRAYEAFLLACPLLSLLCSTGFVPNTFYFAFESAAGIPAAFAIPILLFYWFRRGNPEARWLILPSLAPAAGTVLTNAPQFGELLGWNLNFLARPLLLWGYAPLFPLDVADGIFLLAIGAVMLHRFTSLNREQARVSAELDAARQVQRRLIPETLPDLRGFRFEAAYIPAAEVGGDFYHVMQLDDASTCLILGDVSGKGLKAAMTGALAIGSFRALAAEALAPAELLTRLNTALLGGSQGGFITCLCGRLWPNGRLTLANAGHLLPYRNGEEVPLEGDLPLGIAPNLEYTETSIELHSGDKLMMLTDGVVEAMKPSGELFGFDLTREISLKPAAEVAVAAQVYGQNDDITVLSITVTGEKELQP